MDTIKSGFCTRGLYPWNPNAADYSKSTLKKLDKTVEMEKINYTFFEKQISPDRLREFQATRNRNIDWEGDIQALELYIVWEKLKNRYDKLCGLNGSTNDQVNLDNIPSEIVNICEHSEIGDDIIESLEIDTTSHSKINDEITIHSSAESTTSQDSKISDANTFEGLGLGQFGTDTSAK